VNTHELIFLHQIVQLPELSAATSRPFISARGMPYAAAHPGKDPAIYASCIQHYCHKQQLRYEHGTSAAWSWQKTLGSSMLVNDDDGLGTSVPKSDRSEAPLDQTA
jgi:hypothetical protein